MTNKKTTIAIIVIFAAVLLGAALLYRTLSEKNVAAAEPTHTAGREEADAASPGPERTAEPEPAAEDADLAPDFTVLDSDGNSASLSDHAGKPVVLNFWASWCGPCKSEMPGFDAVAAELAGKVDFMMVNLTDGSRETVEVAKAFIAEQGYTFPVYFDTQFEGAEAYAVRSIPATYFIDADGVVQAYAAGSIREEALRDGIARIMQ